MSLERELGEALGQPVRRLRPASGGMLNAAHAAELADGRRVFVKAHADPPAGTFAAESRRWRPGTRSAPRSGSCGRSSSTPCCSAGATGTASPARRRATREPGDTGYLAGMSTPTMPLTGGCGCGAVRFEVSAPFLSAAFCHCTRCQRRTGSAFAASGRAAPGSFRIVAGEEHVRRWSPEGGFEKAFCGECGSALFGQSPANREVIGVRLGAVDGDPGVRPSAHQFTRYAASWAPIPDDGLPRHPEQIPS